MFKRRKKPKPSFTDVEIAQIRFDSDMRQLVITYDLGPSSYGFLLANVGKQARVSINVIAMEDE